MINNPYKASEFTIFEYERLLQLAIKHFKFIKYTDAKPNENFVLWRHDIDMSLEHALQMAKLEEKHLIQSSYFVHLHNDFYNALDNDSLQHIKDIMAHGHSIGLHFDVSYYNIQSLKQLNYWLAFEKNLMETIFGQEIRVFSYHNTNDYSLSFNADMYAGMINTYSNYFQKQIHYCSDSNGYWRYRKLAEVLTDPSIKQLQVLTHPEWWTHDELQPREKVISYADKKRATTLANYESLLKMTGRLNIG